MKLNVVDRTIVGKKVKRLRNEGLVPAIVYGKDIDSNVNVAFVKNDFLKLYRKVGLSLPIDLEWAMKQTVIVKGYDLDPVTDQLLHVDFLAVNKDQEVETEVPLVFSGESKVEKLALGQLQYVKDVLHIKAKPADLPKEIVIDISVIEETSQVLFVNDITLPKGVTSLDDGAQAIVTVSALTQGDAEESDDNAESTTTTE